MLYRHHGHMSVILLMHHPTRMHDRGVLIAMGRVGGKGTERIQSHNQEARVRLCRRAKGPCGDDRRDFSWGLFSPSWKSVFVGIEL